jgi:Uma2 family endonuclease
MTTAEYLQTPESVTPQELIHGRLRLAEAPAVPHQRMVGRLFTSLDAHVREHGLGEVLLAPVDVVLDAPGALVVQPDLVFVSTARADIVRDCIWGAPDLAVEVLSPRPRIGDVEERIGWFAAHGVLECWLVHQRARRVDVLALDDGRVTSRTAFPSHAPIASRVLPSFRLTLTAIAGY